jgi:ribosomal protein S3AE
MAVQRGIDKWKMKKWFVIHAPAVFKDVAVGEMPANDEKAAVGRNIVVSLDQITHNPTHAYTNVVLKVTEIKGEAAQTKLIRMELLSSYLRSFVRRYRSVSNAVIKVTTKDGTSAVIKLIAITRARAEHTKIVGVRREMTDFTLNYFKENDIDSIVNAIIEGKFQAEVVSKLHHITDLNKIEVRKLEIG